MPIRFRHWKPGGGAVQLALNISAANARVGARRCRNASLSSAMTAARAAAEAALPPCTYSYSAWGTCVNGALHRTVTAVTPVLMADTYTGANRGECRAGRGTPV